MPTGTVAISASVAGLQFTGNAQASEDGQIGQQVTLAAGKAGTLSTRTDNDTGTATLSADHGILTADVVDVFWTGGIRRNMVVGTVSGTSVPLDGGAGDNLPVQDTAVVICKQSVIDMDVEGDLIAMAIASTNTRANIDFQQADGTTIKSIDLAAGGVWYWNVGDTANPFDSVTVGKVIASNGSSTTSATVQIGLIYDSLS
jgi:hypothetical protein